MPDTTTTKLLPWQQYLTVSCPHCGAQVGDTCTKKDGKPATAHMKRIRAERATHTFY